MNNLNSDVSTLFIRGECCTISEICGRLWIITLGKESSATKGADDSLPTASATVNDLSRIWFGSASAEAVSVTGNFIADPELIQKIDAIVQIPTPQVDWDF